MNRFVYTLAVLGLGLAATSAQAMLMQTQTWYITDEADDSIVFNSFDSSLGTLTGVDVLLTGSGNISGGSISGFADYAYNTDPGDFGFSGLVDGRIFAGGPSAHLFILLHGPHVSCFTLSTPGVCSGDYSAAALSFSESRSISPSEFGNYINQNPEFYWLMETDVSELLGQLAGGPSTNWSATGELSLIYTYDPAVAIPAPATLTLLGLGLAGLGWSRRKGA
ncbi:PEP-CTERM sorting domain-containing protein [Parahaliea mediterranea]|uniref:PEP-CTERM sorting domain-containing protein n=1 Tax=Parahaliea mediterranea TaxID=651086 RepID=A0A939DI12_9GAMM|nr:PEP-CTERM sorting domain-containing protein [Parahaliea mediterranea]MBN7798531.1 PEP-CTERM sorting domain-containing protein [Parahaliea mediterranea]